MFAGRNVACDSVSMFTAGNFSYDAQCQKMFVRLTFANGGRYVCERERGGCLHEYIYSQSKKSFITRVDGHLVRGMQRYCS